MKDLHIKGIFIALIIGLFVASGFAQIPQTKRRLDRANQQLIIAEQAEHDRKLEEQGRLPVPKPAVMNVDVQMVLSKADVKTFAEAKVAEAKRVADGDPLWMYIKFKTRLGDYVITTRNPNDREKLRYTLWAEVGPKGDVTALHQFTIDFTKEDLAATELKINLAPGMFGRNKSVGIFVALLGGTKSGVWNNEFRLTNNLTFPRGLADNLASTPIVLDLSGGSAKYEKIESEYDSLTLRGTADVAKLPIAGSYFSDDLKTRLSARLLSEKIQPLKIYFSGDVKQEYATLAPVAKKTKRVFATFTYRQGEQCRYGVAEIVENFDFVKAAYGEPEIHLEKDLPASCDEAN